MKIFKKSLLVSLLSHYFLSLFFFRFTVNVYTSAGSLSIHALSKHVRRFFEEFNLLLSVSLHFFNELVFPGIHLNALRRGRRGKDGEGEGEGEGEGVREKRSKRENRVRGKGASVVSQNDICTPSCLPRLLLPS